jgi:hypothetical protein
MVSSGFDDRGVHVKGRSWPGAALASDVQLVGTVDGDGAVRLDADYDART